MIRTASKVAWAALALTATAAACSSASSEQPPFDPRLRAAHIETAGCGLAADRTGSGIVVADDLVLTVAHLVARSETATVAIDDAAAVDATALVAIDTVRDLALIRVETPAVPDIALAAATAGTAGVIVNSAASGDVPFEVTQVARVTIEEVLGSDQVSRIGYELAAATEAGDSGAGAYDADDRLIGIVFATSPEGTTSWITSSSEIQGFLRDHSANTTEIVCDPEASRLQLP